MKNALRMRREPQKKIGLKLIKRQRMNLSQARGPEGRLQPLKESTLAKRRRKGGSASILVESGKLRRSLKFTVKDKGRRGSETIIRPTGSKEIARGTAHQLGSRVGRNRAVKLEPRVWLGMTKRDERDSARILEIHAARQLKKAER